MTQFETLFLAVKPIVLKVRRQTLIKLWDLDDWLQEGQLTLFLLCSQKPEVCDDLTLLRKCFKTKFSNRITDILRKQMASKRYFDRLPYTEVSEVAHAIPDGQLDPLQAICLKQSLEQVKRKLSFSEHQQFEWLLTGKAFKGRAKLIRKVKVAWEVD